MGGAKTGPWVDQRSLPLGPATPPPAGVETLEGEVVRATYENPETSFRVLKVQVDGKRQLDTFVGVFPGAPPGTRVRATGRRTTDPKYGDQLRVDTLLAVEPTTLAGLERYLASGVIPGIGAAYAKRIVDAFGERTLEVLDREPERLRDVAGIGARRVDAVARAWAAHRAVHAIMIFLQAHGASPSLATRIHKRFGAAAIDIVSRHPYRLALDVWGVGFKTADRIARSLGVGLDAPERAQAGLLHTLVELTQRGHVFTERADLVAQAALMLELAEDTTDAAIDELARSRHVQIETGGGGPDTSRTGAAREAAVYPDELYQSEVRLAARLGVLLAGPTGGDRSPLLDAVEPALAAFERAAGVSLAPAQREAIEQAARHKVLVITGGPGVGKTTIVRALLALFDRLHLRVRLAAPTGRAAKRMSEATGREAVTIHRLLEFDPRARSFARSRNNPIEAAALVVDEASMLDLALADALTSAVSDAARLVLVGDVDQLPSVGPGAVLRDVIASGRVPTVRLTQIFRQAEGSQIVRAAHRIHDGEAPEGASDARGEFYVVERSTPEAAADAVRELVTERIPRRFGLHPVSDVQVLTPMHKGVAGTSALNEMLQGALNPSGAEITRGRTTLRVGDKVMQLRNDYEREVYNGDVGILVGADEAERQVSVRFDDRVVVYEEADFDELTLAYATSIHKSQGSEYPAVVIPILTQHYVMLSRNLLYTAVTRGKRLVVLVADPRAVGIALAEVRREQRRTRLAERLRELG